MAKNYVVTAIGAAAGALVAAAGGWEDRIPEAGAQPGDFR